MQLKTKIKARVVGCADSDLQQGKVWSQTSIPTAKPQKKEKRQHLCLNRLSVAFELLHLSWGCLLLITIFTHVHRSQSECFCCVGLARWPSLTRPDGWFYLTFSKSNHCAKLQGSWQLCFLPSCRLKGSQVAFRRFKTPLYVHQRSFSGWLMAIKPQCAVHVTLMSQRGLFRWIYTICFLGGDAVLQRYSDLWHLP